MKYLYFFKHFRIFHIHLTINHKSNPAFLQFIKPFQTNILKINIKRLNKKTQPGYIHYLYRRVDDLRAVLRNPKTPKSPRVISVAIVRVTGLFIIFSKFDGSSLRRVVGLS